MAESPRDGSDVVRTLGQLIGLAAGFLALLYAAGGGVLALRLYLAHLPSRTIAAQLPRDLLVSIGLAQIIMPILVVAGLYAIYRIVTGPSTPPRRFRRQWNDHSGRGWAELVGASALAALVVTATLGLTAHHVRGGSKGLSWLLPVSFFVMLVFVLVGLNVRARLAERYGDSATSWSGARPLIQMTLVVAMVFLPICVLFGGALFPLLDAKVCTTSGAPIRGVLIGETSTRTYVGQKARPTGPLLVFSIPQSEIKLTIIGGSAQVRPCP
jgi:hypothetical protein